MRDFERKPHLRAVLESYYAAGSTTSLNAWVLCWSKPFLTAALHPG